MEKCLDPLTIDPNVCPAMEPPPGVMPMDPNAQSFLPYVIATNLIGLSLVVPAGIVRMYTKWFILKILQVEDYSALAAFVCFAPLIGVMIKASEYNCCKHQWNVSIADTMTVLKFTNLIQILYSPPMFFAKVALLLQIKRIFCICERNFIFWASWALIVANAAIYIAVTFVFVFACVPREKIWNPMISGKCINANAAMISTAVINMVSDLSILIIPLLGVWDLQMPLKRKIGVASIFATGGVACGAAIVRLVFTVKLIDTNDATYYIPALGICAMAEITTVMLCCSFPTFPRFFKYLRGEDKKTSNYFFGPGSAPKAGPSSGQSNGTNKSARGPYSLDETTQGVELGPYTQLDERTLDSRDAQASNGSQEASGKRTAEFETTSIYNAP